MTDPNLTPLDELELEVRGRLVDLERKIRTLGTGVAVVAIVLLLLLVQRRKHT